MSTPVYWGRRLDAAGLATATPPFALYTNIYAHVLIVFIPSSAVFSGLRSHRCSFTCLLALVSPPPLCFTLRSASRSLECTVSLPIPLPCQYNACLLAQVSRRSVPSPCTTTTTIPTTSTTTTLVAPLLVLGSCLAAKGYMHSTTYSSSISFYHRRSLLRSISLGCLSLSSCITAHCNYEYIQYTR